MNEKGIKREDGKVLCDKCGANLGIEGSTRFVMHWDGSKEYGYVHECVACGARIEQVFKRNKDTAWWG